MEENLKLSDYLILAANFNENPSDENFNALQAYLNKINVKEYMSLKDKDIKMVEILSGITKDFDAPGAAAFLEMGKIEKGLFAYCTNLDVDTGTLLNTYLANDLYYQHGLVDHILVHCEKDYLRLCRMVDNAIQFSNIYRLIESAQLLSETDYNRWMDTMKDIRDTMSSKEIQDIISAIRSVEGEDVSLETILQQQAVQEVQGEYDSERDKFQQAINVLSEKDKMN